MNSLNVHYQRQHTIEQQAIRLAKTSREKRALRARMYNVKKEKNG